MVVMTDKIAFFLSLFLSIKTKKGFPCRLSVFVYLGKSSFAETQVKGNIIIITWLKMMTLT